jgi:AhpD family alkylhydroperoxidase
MKQKQTKESVYLSTEQSYGLVPPLIREIAEFSVPVAALYVDGVLTLNETAFTETEINAAELRISTLNGCESCVKGHSYLLKRGGLGEDDIKAIAEGRPTSITSLNRIIAGTEAVFSANRYGYANYIEVLQREGFTRLEVFELIGILSLKTISNNINNYLKAAKALQAAPVA